MEQEQAEQNGRCNGYESLDLAHAQPSYHGRRLRVISVKAMFRLAS
jgi:hypothetical protein